MQELFLLHVASASILLANHSNVFVSKVCVYLTANLYKIIVTRSMIFSSKCIKTVWRPGSARTRWGSLQHSPDPLAGFRGWAPGKWEEGKGKDGTPISTTWLRPCYTSSQLLRSYCWLPVVPVAVQLSTLRQSSQTCDKREYSYQFKIKGGLHQRQLNSLVN